MSTVKRTAKNVIVLITSQTISIILSFLYIMYIARALGAENFGILSFAIAFTGIFSVLLDIGVSTLTLREISRDNSLAEKYISSGLTLKVILSFINFSIIAFVVSFFDYSYITIQVTYIIGMSTILASFSNFIYSVFRAFEKAEYQSFGQIFNSILMFFGICFAIRQDFSVVGISYVYLLTSILVFLYACLLCFWKFNVSKFEVNLKFLRSIIVASMPFGLTGFFVTIYYYIDTVMISLMVPSSNEAIGWYNAAYRLVTAVLVIPNIYFSAIFPLMAKFHKSSGENLKLLFFRSTKYMAIIAIPLGVGTSLLADKLIHFIYGADYAQSSTCLKILIWSAIFIFISQPFGQLLNSIDKQILVTKITMLGALFNLFLNLLIIPKYSYIGASLTTVITEFFVLSICYFVFRKTEYEIQGNFAFKFAYKISLVCIICGLFIQYFHGSNLLIVIISSIILYLCTLFFIGVIDKKDKEILSEIFSIQDKHIKKLRLR